ncbi:ER membrane protein complex subunit 8 [Aplysia californica]|uniref:ER membrane protein complex subunit 8 n=1 Tax=Aplysia californica TaxID=6500 RepID=A0ABM0K0E1_APLCA|nr:ER membrane protein complex subunit 8 [Aplysia californica]
MADTSVSLQAHCKVLLHAAKYPHSAVNGVLLAEDSKNKDTKSHRCVDCIPLFHVSLGLSPMLEVALLQIDAYCKSKGLVIAGYYQANENYNDNEMNHVARTIGRKIQENFHDACVLMIDNRKVAAETVSQAYKIYTFKETGWGTIEKKGNTEEEILKEECVYALMKSGAQRQLKDFDNHLNDVRNDWRNLELNDMIARCT